LILGVYLSLDPGPGPEKENSTQLQIDLNPKKKNERKQLLKLLNNEIKGFSRTDYSPLKKGSVSAPQTN